MRFVYWLVTTVAFLNATSFAFNLQCSSVSYGDNFYPNCYTCAVKNLYIAQPGVAMTSASSVPTIDQVKCLKIDHQTVNYMPKFSTALAQRLEGLQVSHCHLKSITQNDLRQFPSLRFLFFYYNDLESLDSNLFEFTTKLKVIFFSRNNLKSVGANILEPLKVLTQANFYNAGCINIQTMDPPTVKSELQTKCKSPEILIQIKEIANLKQSVADLEKQKSNLVNENANLVKEVAAKTLQITEAQQLLQQKTSECSALVAQLKRKFESCDRNLDSCTRSLSPLVSQIKTSSAANHTVDIICENFSNTSKICVASDLTIANSGTKIRSIKDKTGIEVEPTSLIIRHQSALFLPSNMHEAFPGLVKLEVSSSGLFVIDQETFKGLDKLTNLNLTSNKLLNITRDLFDDLKSLTTLDLSHNSVESIASKFLSNLKSLESLDMSGNVCIDLKYPETSLKLIEAEVVDKCVAPISITCTSSNDRHVCRAENLQIEQSNVRIEKVNDRSPKNVTELFVEDQIVKFLPHQLAEIFSNLQKLVVSRSQLTLLSKTDFVGLADLKWIEITDNNITSIDAGTFDALPQLEHLDLSSNHIQSLPSKIFSSLTQLQELRLSINEIKILNADILPTTNAIKVFRVDNNQLAKVDSHILGFLKNANEIDFSGNSCIDSKYQKFDETSAKALRLLIGEIVVGCSLFDE